MNKLLLLFFLIPQIIWAQPIDLVFLPVQSQVLDNTTPIIPLEKKGHFPISSNDRIFYWAADSIKTPDKLIDKAHFQQLAQKAVIPVILIGFGFAGSGKKPLLEYSEEVQEEIQEHYLGFHTKIDNYTRYAPIAMAYGLNIAGIKGQHNLVNLTSLFVLSDFISSAATKTLKDVTHQMRPDLSTADAFPSGHTSGAFTGATILFLEYKDQNIWYGIGGYSLAAATGVLRLLNNKHWLSDVLTGAGIGILSTQITYAVYPWIQKQISRDIPKLSNKNMFITPTYIQGSLGLGMIYQLK